MNIAVHRITTENAERFAGLLSALAGEPLPPSEAWALETATVQNLLDKILVLAKLMFISL